MVKIDPKNLQDFFKRKWLNKLCHCCGSSNWNSSDQIYGLPSIVEGKISAESPIFPIITVSCNKCGNTLFFNPLIGGLISRDTPQQQEKKPVKKPVATKIPQ